tara:strand:- start:404 stop:754 length:351 start_codon:yes stop_codon:yes gene_type:complete
MDFSHDIMKQIGEDIQIRRNHSALIAEITSAVKCAVCSDPDEFFSYFQSEEWVDWFVNGWSLVEQRANCPYLEFGEDGKQHTGCPDDDGRLHDSANLCDWEEAVQLRRDGELPILK